LEIAGAEKYWMRCVWRIYNRKV